MTMPGTDNGDLCAKRHPEMTRDRAIDLLLEAYETRRPGGLAESREWAGRWVDVFVALGLLKLEEPKPPLHSVPCLCHESTGGNLSALVREDTLVETLRQIGYEVRKP